MFERILMKNVPNQVLVLFMGATCNLYFVDNKGILNLTTVGIMLLLFQQVRLFFLWLHIWRKVVVQNIIHN